MKNPNRVPLSILMGTSFAAFGIGYIVAPTEPLDTEVTDGGLVSATTTQVLSATVESLRAENKLQVFTYKGAAKVSTGTDGLLFFNGEQELNVPAVVNYYLDLNELTLADVTFDEKAKLVRVLFPLRVMPWCCWGGLNSRPRCYQSKGNIAG